MIGKQYMSSTSQLSGQDNIYRVNDALYGFIFLDRLAWDFIDTPHFQRLRKLKQLACLEYVYPCATHTRFEHAIGTAHLAKKFLTILIKNNPGAYRERQVKSGDKIIQISREKVIESAVRTVTIAALLREIGHGPYSDSFDSMVGAVKLQGEKHKLKWNHQKARDLLFLHMRQHIKQQRQRAGRPGQKLSEEEVERVKSLMRGNSNQERPWEFQIINNKINGIDVEKFDQFRRDAFYLGAKKIFIDHQLLMNEARIINDRICYPATEVETVYNIFHSRYKLYKDYYYNVTSKAIELMINTALNAEVVESHFQIRKACEELPKCPDRFLRLNDSLLDRIEHAGEENQRLGEAVELLRRIKTRRLYKFVKEINYHVKEHEDAEVLDWLEEQLSPAAVVQRIKNIAHINPNDILVTVNDVGFGLEDANPMLKVGFFRKDKEKNLNLLTENEIRALSMLYIDAYVQRSIKVFLKIEEPSRFIAVDAAILEFREKLNDQCQQKFSHDEDHITNGKGGKTPARVIRENSNLSKSSSITIK